MMTKSEVISLLQWYSDNALFTPSPRMDKYEFTLAQRSKFLVGELTRRIVEAPIDADPIEVIREFYYMMDDAVCNSDNPRVWEFASSMENATGEILLYLRGGLS